MKKALAGVVNPSNQYRAFVLDFILQKTKQRKKLEVPLLVIWGKNDSFLERPKRFEWEADATQVEIRLLEANHWVHRERSEEVNELMKDFILRLGTEI